MDKKSPEKLFLRPVAIEPRSARVVQLNCNGSNTFGTMKICSKQRWFELMIVNHSTRLGGIIGIFSIFLNMKVCYVCSLELPDRGNSNEYTQYAFFNMKKEISLNYLKSAAM